MMLRNTIDISILVLLAVVLLCGAYKGAIKQIASLCGVVFGIIAGKLFCETVGVWMLKIYSFPAYLFPAMPFLLIFITMILACSLSGNLLHQFFTAAGVGWFNRCAGAGFAVGKWILLLSILLNIAEITGVVNNEAFANSKKQSVLYRPVLKAAPMLFPYIPITIEHARKELTK